MKKIVFASMFAAAFALPAAADYTVKGSVECPDIVKENSHEHYSEYNKWWLLGYFTARNYLADQSGDYGQVGKGVDSDEIYSMALSFCRDNPGNDWDDAAIDVYNRLK